MNKNHLRRFLVSPGALILCLGLFLSTYAFAESKAPITVVKDHHQSFIDSIGDYLSDEFYSSKDEVWMPAQKHNARVGRGPGDICYQMRYDRKNLTYKLPNGKLLELSRKKYYQGGTLFTDCLINNKFKCMRLYYVGDEFYCQTFEVSGNLRILDMNLNEKKPAKLKNCGLFPMEIKHTNKVFASIGNLQTGQQGLSFGQGDLPKVNLERELEHGKCNIQIENKKMSQKKENIFNKKKTHIIGVAQIGQYKCHLTGGDLNLDGDVKCDGITLEEHFVKCHQGEEVRNIQYTKKCFKDSKETILENDATAIQDSSRRPEVVKPFDNGDQKQQNKSKDINQ